MRDGTIAVGFPRETTGGQRYTDSGSADAPTVASVAFWNERGHGNTPPRPFMREGVEKFFREDRGFIRNLWKNVLLQRISPRTAKERMALKLKDRVQRQIAPDGNHPANAPATIRRKGSSVPLIDTGRMRRAVDAVVRK